MLQRGAEDFTSGGAKYFDSMSGVRDKRIFVPVKVENLAFTLLAAVDTGAPWSVLGEELTEDLQLMDREGEEAAVMTHQGRIRGKLVRAQITLLSQEALGDSLDMDITLLASRDWVSYPILGYGGLIEHIRLGLDGPANLFYFGRG